MQFRGKNHSELLTTCTHEQPATPLHFKGSQTRNVGNQVYLLNTLQTQKSLFPPRCDQILNVWGQNQTAPLHTNLPFKTRLTCKIIKRSEREAAFNTVTSIMQEQDLVKLLAGSAALFRRGLIVVLQQQNLEPMENQQSLKLAPAHRPHWSTSPTSGAPLGKPLTMGLNCSQRTQTAVTNAATHRGQSLCFNLTREMVVMEWALLYRRDLCADEIHELMVKKTRAARPGPKQTTAELFPKLLIN